MAWGGAWNARWSRNVVVLSLFLFAGLASMTVDLPLARAMHHQKILHRLHGFLETIEPFGQPTAIVMTALAIALCDPRRRRLMPRLLAASLGSGVAADIVKLLVARTRPRHHDLETTVMNTFQGILPGWDAGSRMQSFPSAHTATAVGFCLALSTLFPQGSALFAAAAGLVALQRIEAGAHFLSDACFGAALGYAICLVLFRRELCGAWFDRLECSEAVPMAIAKSSAVASREPLAVVRAEE